MNRSILIVICDFLLVSLLAFSTVDINKVAQPGQPKMALSAPAAAPDAGRRDLGEVMRLALDEERKNRDQLMGELSRERAAGHEQDRQIELARSQLQTKEQLAARLEHEQDNLRKQFAAAQSNIAGLSEKLRATTVETVITREQRAAMEAEARKQSERAAALELQLAQLQKSSQAVQNDRMALQNQLQMSEASNRSAIAQISRLQEEVDSRRTENIRLAEDVKALAMKSSDLAREIHDSRPLTPNLIFQEMSDNRVLASFTGIKPGMFGISSTKDKQTRIILVTDETNTFALCHVQDTPLALWSPGAQWEELRGTLARGSAVWPIQSLSFCAMDPRVVLIPVPAAQVLALGCKVYRLSRDPYAFQNAVVVGTRADYYGECNFQIDLAVPRYLKMDHNSLKGLFGKFNPSSGDLVLGGTGELIGVMVNNNYCAITRPLEPATAFRFGQAGRNQETSRVLSSLYSVVERMPLKLR